MSCLRIKRVALQTSALLLLSSTVFATTSAPPENHYGTEWRCTSFHGHWICRETRMPGVGLYAEGRSSQQRRAALVKALGWIPDNSNSQSNRIICGGHYFIPKVPADTQSLMNSPTKVISGNPQYKVGGTLKLEDGVVVTQAGRRLYAEQAFLTPDTKTGKLNSLSATGNIRLRQPGQLILAKNIKANLISHHAVLNDAHYLVRIHLSPQGQPEFDAERSIQGAPKQHAASTSATTHHIRHFTGYAHGRSTQVVQVNAHQYVLHHASYSTCPPTRRAWDLNAEKIVLNQKSGVGTAHNMVLHFYHVPIFYTPYFNFPINNQRKTGLLYPAPNYSTNYGYYFDLPFYLNLAPNYDDTITPQYYTKRGWMLANKFRLLALDSYFTAKVQYVPDDKILHKRRYAYFLNDQTKLPWGFQLTGTYKDISDHSYLRDFSNQNFGNIGGVSSSIYGSSNATIANTAIIPRNVQLNRNGLHWQFNAIAQSYQEIGGLTTENKPYDELPGITLTGQYPYLFSPFSTAIAMGYTNFVKNGMTSSSWSKNGLAVEGRRAYVQPTISLPIQRVYGFITPSIGINAAQYNLKNANDNSISRVLPIFDINSGLYFNRHFTLKNHQYSQTLTPQLFYLYIPYTNQNNIPVFDTTLNQFSFSQLFTTNRFSGEDRINNADQLSAALSTTIDNSKGNQILSASIGQIYYFQRRRVSLCDSSTNPNCIASEQPNYNSFASDLTSTATYNVTPQWSLTTNLNYSPKYNIVDYQTYQVQYEANPRHLFNFEYQYNRRNYGLLSTQQLLDGTSPPSTSQINASLLWGLTPNWNTVGSIDYSVNNRRVFAEFAGLEYDSCCWTLSVVVDHYLSATDPNTPNELNGPSTTGVMLQFQLKGLGSQSVGSSSGIGTLMATLPGYSPEYSGFN